MTNEMLRLKALCTRDEFALYRESRGSRGSRLEQLSARDLRSRVRRARNLRDKYRGAQRRQRSGERGKLPQDRPMELSEFSGTWHKADLFEQVLGRFERRVNALEDEGKREEETKRRPKENAGPRSEDAAPKGPGRAAQYAHGKGTAGPFDSSNRRFQARRDARR